MLPLVAALALAACGNLSKVTKEGTTDNPIWPDAEKTTLRHSGTQNGSWPNWDNVRTIEAGMNKDQIYELIGRPHFNANGIMCFTIVKTAKSKPVNTKSCLTNT